MREQGFQGYLAVGTHVSSRIATCCAPCVSACLSVINVCLDRHAHSGWHHAEAGSWTDGSPCPRRPLSRAALGAGISTVVVSRSIAEGPQVPIISQRDQLAAAGAGTPRASSFPKAAAKSLKKRSSSLAYSSATLRETFKPSAH